VLNRIRTVAARRSGEVAKRAMVDKVPAGAGQVGAKVEEEAAVVAPKGLEPQKHHEEWCSDYSYTAPLR
jgi:hypothetical protein